MSNEKEKESVRESKVKVNPGSLNPESCLYKGIGLIFICIIGFRKDFCVEAPGAMEVCFLNVIQLSLEYFKNITLIKILTLLYFLLFYIFTGRI